MLLVVYDAYLTFLDHSLHNIIFMGFSLLVGKSDCFLLSFNICFFFLMNQLLFLLLYGIVENLY